MEAAASPTILDLADERALDGGAVGAKAANLARSRAVGLPTIPGFALTTTAAAHAADPSVRHAVEAAYRDLVDGDLTQPVVVRSSSTIEDAGTSSMAGQFTSVLDVAGVEALQRAVDEVVASADAVRGPDGAARPIAVLVQLQLDSPLGGVMFGVDPVTGRTDQTVVEVVASRPDTLVGGRVTAAHYVLDRRGRVVERTRDTPATELSPSLRRQLVALAERGATAFDGPQDMEWAIGADGTLFLLQSRPVTAVAAHGGRSHVFGPGPVAETFPDPLAELEQDLFAKPLRDGIVRALQVTGAATEHQLADSPVLTVLDGRVAVDLELLGITEGHRQARSWINPAVILRRLGASWRVGRARAALPALGTDVVATVDGHLAGIGSLAALAPSVLVDLLPTARRELVTVHAYEILAGMLLHGSETGPPAAAVALHALARGRADDRDDAEIVADHPEVLALVPPAIADRRPLPAASPPIGDDATRVDDLGLREALRLRCRWLQELEARAALELGRRLHERGALDAAEDVRYLRLDELAAAAAGGPVPDDVPERRGRNVAAPLPDAFRLTSGGDVVPAKHRRAVEHAGVPAGGGRGSGTARHRVVPGAPRSGVVLVTKHLEPQLAPLLPSLDGLVSETGSVLSHLAILARECHVPTVVGVPDALVRFPPGTQVLVDGATGEVSVIDVAREVAS